jgi:DNA-directed RNA polymerase sigma subunit (sigma70/sigma32)
MYVAKPTLASIGRVTEAFAEAITLALAGKLDPHHIEYALKSVIGKAEQNGPIVYSVAFLAAVLNQPEEATEEDPDRALHLLQLANLTFRGERILRLRFGMEDGKVWALEQVADKYAITRERVRQIESTALAEIRRHLP